jgi:transposase
LEKLAATVDFEIFRPDLDAALGPRDGSKGGRPSFEPVLKFRMLVLQAMHGLSLAQTEFLVADRLSWMRFCGLGPGDTVPDANTLWDFRESLIAAGAMDALFARLDRAITEAGYLPMAGQIVDATLVAAPRQRNTDAEKARIKAGEKAADIWREKPAKATKNRSYWSNQRPSNQCACRRVQTHGPIRHSSPVSSYSSRLSASSKVSSASSPPPGVTHQ